MKSGGQITTFNFSFRSRVSSVSIMITLWVEQPGFDSRHGQGISTLSHCVQTGSEAHPASYPMRIGGFLRG